MHVQHALMYCENGDPVGRNKDLIKKYIFSGKVSSRENLLADDSILMTETNAQ